MDAESPTQEAASSGENGKDSDLLGNVRDKSSLHSADPNEDVVAAADGVGVGIVPVMVSTRQSLVFQSRAEDEGGPLANLAHPSPQRRFYIFFVFIPILVSMWYAAAILFPVGFREERGLHLLLWTDGALTTNEEGTVEVCPRPSICSEGPAEIVMISLARLSAFALYIPMGWTFVTKMHSTVHFLSSKYVDKVIPLAGTHKGHYRQGYMFFICAIIHTVAHFIRYGLRGEFGAQLSTQVGWSGVIGILLMVVVVGSMSLAKRLKNATFEKRFSAHRMFIGVVAAICLHTKRSRQITLSFALAWFLDYLYGVIFRTHRLEVVEFTPLPDKAGTQMLWRNPAQFRPKSGEYVKVQIPWLSKGSNEWHPFSLYLHEATEEGLKQIQLDPEAAGSKRSWPVLNASLMNASLINSLFKKAEPSLLPPHEDDKEEGQVVFEPMRNANVTTGETAIKDVVKESMERVKPSNFIGEEARRDLTNMYNTSQVFIFPAGDWSSRVSEEVRTGGNTLRSCWVKGPFTSPYFVAKNYSKLVLVASGIGITPALGVIGQYPGNSRTKVLIWSLRCADMLKFFAPSLKDVHVGLVFYTGKKKLTNEELRELGKEANIHIYQKRPDDLADTISSLVVALEQEFALSQTNGDNPIKDASPPISSIADIDSKLRQSWCVLYCGGSTKIKSILKESAKKIGVGFQSELFDW